MSPLDESKRAGKRPTILYELTLDLVVPGHSFKGNKTRGGPRQVVYVDDPVAWFRTNYDLPLGAFAEVSIKEDRIVAVPNRKPVMLWGMAECRGTNPDRPGVVLLVPRLKLLHFRCIKPGCFEWYKLLAEAESQYIVGMLCPFNPQPTSEVPLVAETCYTRRGIKRPNRRKVKHGTKNSDT